MSLSPLPAEAHHRLDLHPLSFPATVSVFSSRLQLSTQPEADLHHIKHFAAGLFRTSLNISPKLPSQTKRKSLRHDSVSDMKLLLECQLPRNSALRSLHTPGCFCSGIAVRCTCCMLPTRASRPACNHVEAAWSTRSGCIRGFPPAIRCRPEQGSQS